MKKSVKYSNVEMSSTKSFGITFSIVFLIVALYPGFGFKDIKIWALLVSILFLILTYTSPKVLFLPNKLWHRFGILLGIIIAPIIMTLIYFLTVLPTGIIVRLLGKDLLKQKLDRNTNSYWELRTEPLGSMKNQF